MYSEKLKELIKLKTPLKFRIRNKQQSKELQKILFGLGVGWLWTPHFELQFEESDNICLDFEHRSGGCMWVSSTHASFEGCKCDEFLLY